MRIDKNTVVYLINEESRVTNMRFCDVLLAARGGMDEQKIVVYTDEAMAVLDANAAMARQAIMQDLQVMPPSEVKQVIGFVAKLLHDSNRPSAAYFADVYDEPTMGPPGLDDQL